MLTNKFQQDVDKRTSQFKEQYFPQAKILEKLEEELEEVRVEAEGIILTENSEEKDAIRAKLGAEIVDLLFAAMCLANSNGIDIDTERDKMMIEKRYGRDNNRFEKKE